MYITSVVCEGQVLFQKTYGGLRDDYSRCGQQTLDGGYIIAGSTFNYGVIFSQIYLIKADINGDTLWTKTYEESDSYANYVQQTADGGYIITGKKDNDVYLLKTDSIGNLLWSKTYGGVDNEQGECVQQTIDGGFIITGYTDGFLSIGCTKPYLIRTDSIGNLIWSKMFGYGSTHCFNYTHDVQHTMDGGYIVVGTVAIGSTNRVYLIKLDLNGDTLWTKKFGGSIGSKAKGLSIQETSDGGFIITGSFYGVYLVKTDSMGNIQWAKVCGGSSVDVGCSVKQTIDGGYIVAGYISNFGYGGRDAYLIKTDSIGNTLWAKTFGGTSDDFSFSVNQTMDGGYFLVGRTESFGSGSWDVYVIKTDSLGNAGCNESFPSIISTSAVTEFADRVVSIIFPPTIETSSPTIVGSGGIVTTICTNVGFNDLIKEEVFDIYPNPFNEHIFISPKNNDFVEFILYDITGRNRLQQLLLNSNTLNTEQLSNGIYFYEARNKNGYIKKGKLVKTSH